MSLASSHSPKLSLSGSYTSTLRFTKTEAESIRHVRHSSLPQGLVYSINEATPLMVSDMKNAVKGRSAEESEPATDVIKPQDLHLTLLVTIFVVTIGSSLQFGYGTGVMNNSQEVIMEYFHNQGKEYTVVQWSTTVSCYGIGGLLGSLLGPKVIGAYCGRRATLIINNIFLVLSSVSISFAPQWWYQAVGRVFVGIVAGIATAVVPTYFSEISPIAIRGAVGTMHQLGITVGIFVSQALSTPSLNLLGSVDRWKWLFAVPVFFGLLEVIVLPFCPESPSYLYTTQGKGAAKEALVQLQSKSVADEYLRYIIEETQGSGNGSSSMSIFDLLQNQTIRKQLIVGITVQLMMQFSASMLYSIIRLQFLRMPASLTLPWQRHAWVS